MTNGTWNGPRKNKANFGRAVAWRWHGHLPPLCLPDVGSMPYYMARNGWCGLGISSGRVGGTRPRWRRRGGGYVCADPIDNGQPVCVQERTVEKPCLNDQDESPDDEVLTRCLGSVKPTWDSFLAFLREDHPSFVGEWRYYQDGKSWLYKVTQKKKTVCWVSVYTGHFKTTFYFPDRAEELITASKLKKEYIEQFVHGKKYGKIRGVTVTVKKPADLLATAILIGIEEQVK